MICWNIQTWRYLFTRIYDSVPDLFYKDEKDEKERFAHWSVPLYIIYITSLFSVLTGSNHPTVAGNCSSLLLGASQVQSCIHEFLVCSLSCVSSLPTSLSPSSSAALPSLYPGLRLLYMHVEYLACVQRIGNRKAKLIARDHRKCKVCIAFMVSLAVSVVNLHIVLF